VNDQTFILLLKPLSIAAILGLVVLHYLYLLYRWKQQIAAENTARMQALNSRIRPHFLFNSMNTIASLTRTDPLKAEEMVENLADLFRVSLGEVHRQSTLGRELELARQYLSIENQRLGERLNVVWDLEGMPESATLPPLTLQPLLENAVYHGIEPAAGGGTIVITGRYRKKRLNLSIRNTLPNAPQSTHRKGNKLALENIRQRLKGLYDEAASLTESRIDGDHQVRIVIPYPRSMQ
jgi:two-component system sensor histidine kinase AlgZ